MSPVLLGEVPYDEYVHALTPDERREFEAFVNEKRQQLHREQKTWALALGNPVPEQPAEFTICDESEDA